MSKYELDMPDQAVPELIGDLVNMGAWGEVVRQLRTQIPIPVPVKIGAVVRTDSGICAPDTSVFLRWASDSQTSRPWILREELDLKTYNTVEMGRIVSVLSPGVDL